ncbi:glutathione S-transferase N-terminal domain-containing protein [Eikenella sp. S3360]|uniref:Glutathione S-transferase N-terminal domain-containing protein n=1 Tax=Eikenella glucosivorans TaxID=2766967 RepID=A0ABS0NAX0_9NEIS|nr:glutathione S-transferase N-terminal domain-containing protein [Eikenella glucosivorans]MBH5329459.1 glutathione S-transferase N-terminal domain-containing protein [Eikenella glucosivorans]
MKLYTSSTSPFGRLVLLAALPRRDIDFAIAYVNPWENPAELQALNPFSQVPTLQTDSGAIICNSPFILDFLLGHPLHNAAQSAAAGYAFILLEQLVKVFGLQKFKTENTPDHPLLERARAACIRGLSQAPQLDAAAGDLGNLALGMAFVFMQFRLPDLQPHLSPANQNALERFTARTDVRAVSPENLEHRPATLSQLRQSIA